MKLRATVELLLRSAEEASTLASSLRVDNGRFVTTKVKGSSVVASAEAKDPMALLHTLDDYLMCAAAAVRIITRSRRAP